jgi:hypothetical protein
MKKVLCVIAALLCATAANAVEMPQDFRGEWCYASHDEKTNRFFYVILEDCKSVPFSIDEKGFGQDDGGCEVVKILSRKKVDRPPEFILKVSARCTTADGPTIFSIHEFVRFKDTLTVRVVK